MCLQCLRREEILHDFIQLEFLRRIESFRVRLHLFLLRITLHRRQGLGALSRGLDVFLQGSELFLGLEQLLLGLFKLSIELFLI